MGSSLPWIAACPSRSPGYRTGRNCAESGGCLRNIKTALLEKRPIFSVDYEYVAISTANPPGPDVLFLSPSPFGFRSRSLRATRRADGSLQSAFLLPNRGFAQLFPRPRKIANWVSGSEGRRLPAGIHVSRPIRRHIGGREGCLVRPEIYYIWPNRGRCAVRRAGRGSIAGRSSCFLPNRGFGAVRMPIGASIAARSPCFRPNRGCGDARPPYAPSRLIIESRSMRSSRLYHIIH